MKRMIGWVTVMLTLAAAGPAGAQPSDFEVARLRASLQQVVQEHERLLALLEQNRQVTEAVMRRLQALEAKVANEPTVANPATRADIDNLRQEIAAERAARERALAELIRSVSQEIAKASTPPARPPAGGGVVGPAPVASQGTYTVMAGDTLSTISQAFGVSVQALRNANNLTGDLIRVGQPLVIPAR